MTMKPLDIIKDLLKLSQPLLWLTTSLPFVLAYLCSGGKINVLFWITTFYFLIGYNLLFHGSGRLFHSKMDSPETTAKTKQSRLIFIWAIVLTNLVPLAYLLTVLPMTGRMTLLLTILLALGYNVRIIHLRGVPFLDILASALAITLPAVCGLVFVGLASWPWTILAALLLWAIGSQALGTAARLSADRKEGIRSTAVFWGIRRTVRLSLWGYISSVLLLLTFFPQGIFLAILASFYVLNINFFLKYKSDALSNKFRRAWQNYLWLNPIIALWLLLYLFLTFDPWHLDLQTITLLSWLFIFITLLQLLILLHNFASFRLPKTTRLHEWPRVSILIHAYNQADNIASTLLAALGQNYPNYEIIFTDLDSGDNTKKIAEGYNDKKLKIISIDPPRSGWSVNSWASNELLKHASGEISLILSADTVMLPNALSNIASLIKDGRGKDLISLLPADQNKTLAQKLILSHNQALFLSVFPVAFLSKNFPQFSSAYGGMMAFATDKIRLIRGLELVKSSPLEDYELASQAKLHGLKTAFYLASGLALSQNHADLRHIISQNIQRYYPALRFSYPLTVAVFISGLFAFTGPAVVLLITLISGQFQLLPLILIAVVGGYLVRLIVALRGKQNVFAITLYPLSNLVVMATLGASVAQYELLKPRWQKRTEL